MFITTILLSAALAQEPVVAQPGAEISPVVPVVDVVAPRAGRRAEALVVAGRATFFSSASVLGAGVVMWAAGAPTFTNNGDVGAATVGGLGVVGVGLGAVGMIVGGSMWGAGKAQQRHLEVTVAPTVNGMVVAGRF